MAHDVFISYASPDKPTADAICARLEEQGIRCWYAPRDIPPGASWPDSILDALTEAQIMVLVFSGHANESDDVAREVERAAGQKMTIIPVRIADVKPTKGMDYFLSRPHWLDALTAPLEEHIDRLAQAIKPLLGSPEGLAPVDVQGAASGPPLPVEKPAASRRGLWTKVAVGLGALAILATLWAVWSRSSQELEDPLADAQPEQAEEPVEPSAEEPPLEPEEAGPSVVAAAPPPRQFIIVAAHSKKCLELRAASHEAGAAIEQRQCAEPARPSQRFRLSGGSEGGQKIVSVESGQCVEVRDASLKDGAQIQQGPCARGKRSQLFRFEVPQREAGDRRFIQAIHSGKCLDVPWGRKKEGLQLVQFTCGLGLAQLFSLPEVG